MFELIYDIFCETLIVLYLLTLMVTTPILTSVNTLVKTQFLNFPSLFDFFSKNKKFQMKISF